MSNETSYLTITVDKSHLITIGERLYEQSIELIRELVNNAYDADATRVDVNVSDQEIVVSDNGEGMDIKGLTQYFNVGSDEKLMHPVSPRFGRNRIGQFGIGKFASLAAAGFSSQPASVLGGLNQNLSLSLQEDCRSDPEASPQGFRDQKVPFRAAGQSSFRCRPEAVAGWPGGG